MNDNDLADALVDHLYGGDICAAIEDIDLESWADLHGEDAAKEMIALNWSVAGACLERWPTTINTEHLQLSLDEMLRIPAAICEAFVESMK